MLIQSAQRLHGHHVLGTRQRELHQFEDRVAHALHGADACRERYEQHVEPGNEETDGPSNEDEQEKPDDCIDEAWTDIRSSFSFALTHDSEIQKQKCIITIIVIMSAKEIVFWPSLSICPSVCL